jgi:hypothetical protein
MMRPVTDADGVLPALWHQLLVGGLVDHIARSARPYVPSDLLLVAYRTAFLVIRNGDVVASTELPEPDWGADLRLDEFARHAIDELQDLMMSVVAEPWPPSAAALHPAVNEDVDGRLRLGYFPGGTFGLEPGIELDPYTPPRGEPRIAG